MSDERSSVGRRSVLKAVGAAGAGTVVSGSKSAAAAPAGEPDRLLRSGTEEETPLYVNDSGTPGMTALVVGGMHGNETAGHLAATEIANWTPSSGRLVVLPRANAKGVEDGVREPNGDLNRQFPLESTPTTPLAREIWDVVTEFSPDLIIDLHESWSRFVNGGLGQSVAYSPVRNLRGAATIACDTINETIGATNNRFHERLLPSPAEYPHGVFVQRTAFELGIPSYLIETYVDLGRSDRVHYHTSLVKKLLDVRATTHDAGEPDHVLAIQSTGQKVTYEGAVDGTITPTDMLGNEDTVGDGAFSGVVWGGTDYYQYSGRLTDFSITGGDQSAIEIRLDGEPKSVNQLTPADTSQLTVRSTGEPVEYQLGVDKPFISVQQSANGWVFEDRAYGEVADVPDSYEFAYDLDQFDVTEGDPSDLELTLDGSPISIDDLDETPSHELLVNGRAGKTTYRLTVNGTIKSTDFMSDEYHIQGPTAVGTVTTGVDLYRFTGEILSFEIVSGDESNVELMVDGNDQTVSSLNPSSVHTLSINSTGDRVDYSGTVSETVYPTPLLNGSDRSGIDKFSGGVWGGTDQYLFKGDLTTFSIDRGRADDVTVSVDGERIALPPIDKTAVEGGSLTVDDPWQTYSLGQSFDSPVTTCSPLSYAGSQPCHVRLRNVGSNGFDARIEEWDYLNGVHYPETASHVTIEAGVHEVESGRYAEAGRTVTDHEWRSVSFDHDFDTTPLVFCQAETVQGGQAIVTRVRNVSRSGFDVKVQESEAQGTHKTESIGYIAIEPATNAIGDRPAELGVVAVDDGWTTVNFDRSYEQPVFVACMQTTIGGDAVGLRRKNLTGKSVALMAEEETSRDSETAHATEQVGYLVFEE
ncbi:succinylglutamate desuccinylase/aspartoacylase domain-containing protein [Halocatena halophila]|uniref:succinylglutamate desuccinylase/aspartoacylase domain-containing protein n=1 Tax=Halocatena halophila TaxID=2814576 RepID=UPI002ECFB67B